MTEDRTDATLKGLFTEAFTLSRAERDGLRRQFEVLRTDESLVWGVFTAIMTGLHGRLHPALDYARWGGWGVSV